VIFFSSYCELANFSRPVVKQPPSRSGPSLHLPAAGAQADALPSKQVLLKLCFSFFWESLFHSLDTNTPHIYRKFSLYFASAFLHRQKKEDNNIRQFLQGISVLQSRK